MFLIRVGNWKGSKCLSVGDRLDKMWSISTMTVCVRAVLRRDQVGLYQSRQKDDAIHKKKNGGRWSLQKCACSVMPSMWARCTKNTEIAWEGTWCKPIISAHGRLRQEDCQWIWGHHGFHSHLQAILCGDHDKKKWPSNQECSLYNHEDQTCAPAST